MRILLAIVVSILSLTSLVAAAEKKIVVTGTSRHWWALNDEAVAGFREAAGDARFVVARGREALAREIADADGLVGGLPRDLFAEAKRLKWVQTYSAGVEAYHQWPQFVDSEVVLTNCKIVQGPTIADHAMGMLLAFTRGLAHYIPARTKEEWDRSPEGLIELEGKTAVVIGFGGIGSEIARRARAFGMNVIGVDPKDIPAGAAGGRMIYPDQLDEVLPEADVVFVAAPHTRASEGMIGPRQFELMKKGSYFIAVSRGKLYDMPSLVKALDSRKLAGAGVDVTDPEPLPKGHPLWEFPNVIITPHIASQSPGSRARRLAVVRNNIERFVQGRPLLNVVDKAKGY